MDRYMMHRQTLGLVALSIVCLIVGRSGSVGSTSMVAGSRPATQGGVSLAFRTLVHGAAPGGQEARPSLQLVRTEAQRTALAARLSAVDHPTLGAVDLATSVVIAAFQGLRPTSGYRIDILAVEASDTVLEVTVKRSAPAPGEPVRHGFESPYQLVQVARETFEDYHFASYRLRDASGDVLQEGPIDTLGRR